MSPLFVERRARPRLLPVGEASEVDPLWADTIIDEQPASIPVVSPEAIPGLEVIEIFTDD